MRGRRSAASSPEIDVVVTSSPKINQMRARIHLPLRTASGSRPPCKTAARVFIDASQWSSAVGRPGSVRVRERREGAPSDSLYQL